MCPKTNSRERFYDSINLTVSFLAYVLSNALHRKNKKKKGGCNLFA